MGKQPPRTEHVVQELEKKNALLGLLQQVAVAANEAASVEEVFQFTLDLICAYSGWPVGHVYLRTEEAPRELIPSSLWHGADSERYDAFRRATAAICFAPGAGLPGRVLSSGAPVWVSDLRQDPNFQRAGLEDLCLQAAFAFPVLVGREVAAVLEFFSEEAAEPDPAFLDVMATVGTQLGRVVERTRKHRQSAHALEQVTTERKRLEVFLRQEMNLADSVINSLPGLFYLFDEDGRMLRWNRNVEAATGYTAAEIATMHPLDFIAERAAAAEKVQKVFQEGQALFEGHLRTKEGTCIPFLFTGTRFMSDGKPYLIGTGMNISARKEAEGRIAFLAEAGMTLASTLDYEETLQHVANLIVPRLADWCAVSIIASDGRTLEQVGIAHVDPDKLDRVQQLRRRYPPEPDAPYGTAYVLQTGRPAFYPEIPQDALFASARDAAHLQLLQEVGFKSVIIVPMQARGHTLGAITLVWSDSDRRYSEADLHLAEELARRAAMEVDNARLYRAAQQARREAEEMSRLKSSFLANMSHEIRTPLTSIVGFASLLAERVPEKERAYAHRIESGGRRLLETINAVLALAQLEANQAVLQPEALNIAEEARLALELMEGQARKKHLALQLDVKPGAGEACSHLDRGALSSIIQNLVGNAIKFTEQGTITVRIAQDAERVHLHVADTGVGIDPALLSHLFEPFWQESKGWGRSHEGTGLGLSITKRLIEGMGAPSRRRAVRAAAATLR